MKMSMGDGLGTMVALNVLLLDLVVFIQYLLAKKKVLYVLSLAIFFLTLEAAPQRTSSALLILLLLDWMVSFKDKKAGILKRNLCRNNLMPVSEYIKTALVCSSYGWAAFQL